MIGADNALDRLHVGRHGVAVRWSSLRISTGRASRKWSSATN